MTLVTWLVALWLQGLALAILSGHRDGYVRASFNLLKMPLRTARGGMAKLLRQSLAALRLAVMAALAWLFERLRRW